VQAIANMTDWEEPRRPIDWGAFVEQRRLDELARRYNRPSQMLARYAPNWREPPAPRPLTFLGSLGSDMERAEDRATERNRLVADKLQRIMRKPG